MKDEESLPSSNNIEVDIVVPLFNESQGVEQFHQRLVKVVNSLPYTFKIYYVDDGSTDGTDSLLRQIVENDDRVYTIQLTRNFGHQAALTAGIECADGDVVITMDGDGQHPPELIPQLLERYHEGYEIVQTQRIENGKTSLVKNITSRWFYKVINFLGTTKIIPGAADFRLMTHEVVIALRNMKEYHRFIRGMIPWMGYSFFILPYSPEKRIAGKTKYTPAKMLNLAEDAIFSFSLVPLRIGLMIGSLFILLAIIEAIYVLSFFITGKISSLAPGWSSIVFLILITGGSLLIMISLVGIYVGQIHQEVKQRPIYIIKKIHHQ
jgi:polyisoprenyl-phosphate glycosyltransferase